MNLFNTGNRVCLDADAFDLSGSKRDDGEGTSMMIQTDAGNDEGVLCSKCGVPYPKVAVVDVADPERSRWLC